MLLKNEREERIYAEGFWMGRNSDEELKNKMRVIDAMWLIEREAKDEKPMSEERFREIVKGIIKALER